MADGDGGAGGGLGWRWDVALSFAGAQRDYVEQVAAALKERGLRCFYDAEEQIELWGRYLAEELPAIYGEQAAAVVVFISADYLDRDWTRLERRAALGRAVRERREYVLPARFDDTPLPGLLSDMVTVDLRRYTTGQFADMVAAKLAGLDITAPAPAAPVPLAGPVDLVLTVTGGQVRLSGGGVDASAGHGGVRAGLAEAVNEARRVRGRAGLAVRDLAGAPAGGGELPVARAGRLLAESFLPGPVAAALERVLAGAERAHQLVRVGLEVVAGHSR